MVTNRDEKHQNTPVEPKRPEDNRGRTLDEVWPVHSAAMWPEGLSLRREDIYDDRLEPLSS